MFRHCHASWRQVVWCTTQCFQKGNYEMKEGGWWTCQPRIFQIRVDINVRVDINTLRCFRVSQTKRKSGISLAPTKVKEFGAPFTSETTFTGQVKTGRPIKMEVTRCLSRSQLSWKTTSAKHLNSWLRFLSWSGNCPPAQHKMVDKLAAGNASIQTRTPVYLQQMGSAEIVWGLLDRLNWAFLVEQARDGFQPELVLSCLGPWSGQHQKLHFVASSVCELSNSLLFPWVDEWIRHQNWLFHCSQCLPAWFTLKPACQSLCKDSSWSGCVHEGWKTEITRKCLCLRPLVFSETYCLSGCKDCFTSQSSLWHEEEPDGGLIKRAHYQCNLSRREQWCRSHDERSALEIVGALAAHGLCVRD